jgi:hypothetical protein
MECATQGQRFSFFGNVIYRDGPSPSFQALHALYKSWWHIGYQIPFSRAPGYENRFLKISKGIEQISRVPIYGERQAC